MTARNGLLHLTDNVQNPYQLRFNMGSVFLTIYFMLFYLETQGYTRNLLTPEHLLLFF